MTTAAATDERDDAAPKIYDDDVCAICMGTSGAVAPPYWLARCRHAFCRECIASWARKAVGKGQRPSCPLCKAPFTFDDEEDLCPAGSAERDFDENTTDAVRFFGISTYFIWVMGLLFNTKAIFDHVCAYAWTASSLTCMFAVAVAFARWWVGPIDTSSRGARFMAHVLLGSSLYILSLVVLTKVGLASTGDAELDYQNRAWLNTGMHLTVSSAAIMRGGWGYCHAIWSSSRLLSNFVEDFDEVVRRLRPALVTLATAMLAFIPLVYVLLLTCRDVVTNALFGYPTNPMAHLRVGLRPGGLMNQMRQL